MTPNQAFNAGFYACIAGVQRSDSPAEMVGDVLLAWRRGWDYCNRGANSMSASTTDDAHANLEARAIAAAAAEDVLAEVCDFVEYDPSIGRVPGHWRVKFPVMAVLKRLAT